MERVYGNIFVRDNGGLMNAGDIIPWHDHNFDHLTLCVSGRCIVRGRHPGKEERTLELGPEDGCHVRAATSHQIEILEDGTKVLCIFAHRDPDTGEVVEQYNAARESYV